MKKGKLTAKTFDFSSGNFIIRLNILVNNAGAGNFGKQKTDGFLTLMLTNYFGPFFLTSLLLGKFLILHYCFYIINISLN